MVDVLLADSKEEAGLTEEELAYFSGQNGGEDIDTEIGRASCRERV